MKKSFKLFSIVAIVTSLVLSLIVHVIAGGSATLSITGNSSVAVGDEITLSVVVSNVTSDSGGVESVGGTVTFDTAYLEYVSSTGATSPYSFSSNKTADGKYKIAGIDFTASAGITTTTTVYTFVFKALQVGSTTVSFVDGELSDNDAALTTTYNDKNVTITTAKAVSSDATLSSLGVTGYTLSPTFSSGVTNYTLTVPNSVSSIDLTGTTTDSNASITGLGTKTLSVGSNAETVTVTAEDGTTTQTYTVTVTREAGPTVSNDATLSSLGVTGYTLSPTFSSGVTNYTLTVPNSVSSVDVTGTATSSSATVSGTGTKSLSVGSNTATVTVTAEDGTTKETYTVTITREAGSSVTKSSDSSLKSLSVTGYTLSPAFNTSETSYSMSVGSSVTGITVSGIANDSKATVTVTGNNNLVAGNNVVKVTVTAEDGSQKIYTINVTKASSNTGGSTTVPTTNKGTTTTTSKSTNNYLKQLSTNDGTLSPTFIKITSNYSITVPYDKTSLDLTALVENSGATVAISGNSNFKVGENNVVEVTVTAADGTQRVYTINVTRSALVANNKLTGLTINGVNISPSFNPTTYEYTATVPANASSLDVSAIASDGATVEVSGNDNLKEGNNVVLIKVTDKDGYIQYYKVNVNKSSSSAATLFGTSIPGWAAFAMLGAVALIVVLVLTRQPSPVIEFKSEFNYANTNGLNNNDANSSFKQEFAYNGRKVVSNSTTPKDNTKAAQAVLPNTSNTTDNLKNQVASDNKQNRPTNPYEGIVSKDEIVDALNKKSIDELQTLIARGTESKQLGGTSTDSTNNDEVEYVYNSKHNNDNTSGNYRV